jgi:F-type H+-transporting ATPase subunit b
VNLNATIFAQIIVFAIVVWVAMKFLWPQITVNMTARQKRIAEGLAAAERGQKDLAEAETRVNELVKAARERALAIEQQAHAQGSDIVEAAKRSASSEGQRLIENAQAQVALELQKARDELRSQVAALAVSGASQIVGREIDAKTHAELLDKLAAGL